MMDNNKDKTIITLSGCIGTAIAVTLSYAINHSIGWCILHGIFGWFYVIYYVIKY